jgi:anti-sigma regulatory factor (Ser/Thr protein kinase)
MEMTPRITTGTQVQMEVSGQSDIGECRRSAKRLGDGFSFDETTAGRIAIITTELTTNIVRHAGSGEILLQVLDDGMTQEFEVLAIDKGPGMRDVGVCMTDGFSTGGTAGQGLGAVSRLSSTFDIHSTEGKGTVALARIARSREPAPFGANRSIQLGAINVAVAGEIECGDTWRMAQCGTRVSVLVADGLGHGPLAATAAQGAALAFLARPFDDPSTTMQNLHRRLSGTRGAAAACAVLDIDGSNIKYSGVGNITGSVVTAERTRGMVSHNGTLGVQLLRSQQFEYEWPRGSHVVMHSDGLSARWALPAYPGLQMRHPGIIAAMLYRDFVRRRDDATVIVACCRA